MTHPWSDPYGVETAEPGPVTWPVRAGRYALELLGIAAGMGGVFALFFAAAALWAR